VEAILIKVKYAGDKGRHQFLISIDEFIRAIEIKPWKCKGPIEEIKICKFGVNSNDDETDDADELRGDF
jgi:hypothetical protein